MTTGTPKPHDRLLRALRAADGRTIHQADLAEHTGLSPARVHAAAAFLTELGLVGRRGPRLRAMGTAPRTLEEWIDAAELDIAWARRAQAS